MRTTSKLAVRMLAVIALLPCLARADIVHFKDGRTLEGTISARTATEITVTTEFGKVVVPLSKVKRIEEKRTAAQELAVRRAALPAGDAAALFELALWARDSDLAADSRALMREVVALVPDHSLANEALGRLKVDGLWLDPGDVEAYVREHEAERRLAGLLWNDGSWQPEAQVMRQRGFVRVHEAWVARRPGETTLLLEDLASIDIPLRATVGTYVTLYSELLPESAEALVFNLDNVVKDLLQRFPPDETELASLTRYDIPVLALPNLDAVARLMDSDILVHYGASVSFRERFRASRGFSLYFPRPLIGLVAHGENLELAGDEDLGRLGFVTHQLAHVLLQRLKSGARAPGWVEAGLAAFYEGAVTQYATITITSFARGADNAALDPFVKDWEDYTHWNENLQQPKLVEQAGRLAPLMSQRVEELDSREIGVSWSVVTFLMQQHADELRAYLRAYDSSPDAAGKDSPLLHKAAWQASFGEEVEQVQRAWQSWAQQQPPILIPPRLLSLPM